MENDNRLLSPDDYLQMLLDRYSMVGEEADPKVLGIANANARYASGIGPRLGKLYGELTRSGLVHAWADTDRTDYARAHTLVLTNSFLTVNNHIYNRHPSAEVKYNWTEEAGRASSVPVYFDGDDLKLATYNEVVSGKYGEELESAQRGYSRVVRELAKCCDMDRKFDALHQAVAYRYPSDEREVIHKAYAGEPVGPRVNMEEMIRAGVPLGAPVIEALSMVPPIRIM